VIAKADTINKNELAKFKAKIMSELKNNGVSIYQFPTDDETVAEVNKEMNNCLPFAVVGSRETVKVGNKHVRARQYPWGVVQVENENHCDFKHLREMLIRTNMEDLRNQTQLKHYELYRKERLKQMGFSETDSSGGTSSFAETYTLRRDSILKSLQSREEEMRQKFVIRVKEKEAELKEAERELHCRFDKLKATVNEERRMVDEQKRALEEEIAEFQRRKSQYENEKMNSGHNTLTLGKLGKKK